MIVEDTVSIPFAAGVDTKTSSAQVEPPKLLQCQNAVFINPKRVAKRNGYSGLFMNIIGGGTLTPIFIDFYSGGLIAGDGLNLYSYSPTAQGWVLKGPYTSIEVTDFPVEQTAGTPTNTGSNFGDPLDSCVLGNIGVFLIANVGAVVVDLQTNEVIEINTVPANTGSVGVFDGRCVVFGATTIGVFYNGPVSSGTYPMNLTLLTVTSGSVTWSAPTNEFNGTILNSNNGRIIIDVQPTTTGAVVVFSQSNTTLVAKSYASNGSAIASNSITGTGSIFPLTIAIGSDNRSWIYAVAQSNGHLHFALLDSSLNTVTAYTDISNVSGCNQLMAAPTSTTGQQIWHSIPTTNATGGNTMNTSYAQSINVTGGLGTTTVVQGILPVSHSFAYSGTNYAYFAYGSANLTGSLVQPTLFMLQLSNQFVAARYLSGVYAYNAFSQTYALNDVYFSGTKAFLLTSEYTSQGFFGQSFPNSGPTQTQTPGTTVVSADFASQSAYFGVTVGNTKILNGSVVSEYDSESVTELNFNLFPEIVYAKATTGSGADLVAPGTYAYYAVYQWTDAQGNIHQSAPSLAKQVTVVTGTSSNLVTLGISNPWLTQKSGVQLAVYRTQNGGTVPYNIILTGNPETSTTGDIVIVQDIAADSAISIGQQLYTVGEVANSAPPPSVAITSHNNRLWLVDSESKNTIWYSKPFVSTPGVNSGIGVSPSAFLTQQVDQKIGSLVGIADMDEKLIMATSKGWYFMAGDGASNAGTGSTLTTPQIIPGEAGLGFMKSLVLMRDGLMFAAANSKGIFLLGRGLQIVYIGADVESYNGQTYATALNVPNTTQVRFLATSGTTLVYDYFVGQWGTFTNHAGFSATIWQGLYTYLKSDNTVYQENLTNFIDGSTSYSVLIQTAWLSAQGKQGWERARRIVALGTFENGTSGGHAVNIQAAYDRSPTLYNVGAGSYTFGASTANGVWQFRDRLPQQKCQAVSFVFSEVTTNRGGEYVDFTDLALEVGRKKGSAKLPPAQTVG